ncbi:protein METABOLIC NETWORK MODULATOR 1 isoform X2 [Salvia miltiorrhiza]|uniref:protein METABOLIC NETWORK MODULATOR 1 isoform X2 n=1 Tax=Salvia miltiorrhiza TaxID=226208 RepID=UPI0025AD4A06|nr:protein METABOLIC NETWORK MODULATOR 1 isoform X2 [Salvia miltiorrhiza]XP_057795332.1 protein METABOLIC NETWORK MODULATOR 1 isoform X2 [Salvia miltiorrhiza]
MNQYNQGEGSSGLSILPLKRRRGRPRKDPSLKRAQAAHAPPGFEGAKEYHPQRADGVNSMVGQAVSGVVEATFDAGYLLTVRIGNSTTKLRGVVFKPGHYVPVTAENDVAPHLQMIRRNDVQLPAEKHGWSRRQKLAIQAGALVPSKRKSRTQLAAPSVPPVGARGSVVPVVLQPISFQNGVTSNQMPSDTSRTPHVMSFGDRDVHMVEPLSMLPPDKSIPVSQLFLGTQPHTRHQSSQGTEQNDNNPFIGGGTSEVGQGGKLNPTESTENENTGSSESSDTQTDSGKEATKSSAEDSGAVSKQDTGNTNEPFSTESVQSASVTKPFFNYGTGRMTELLQENMKENQVQIAEHPPSGSNKDADVETDPKLEASATAAP